MHDLEVLRKLTPPRQEVRVIARDDASFSAAVRETDYLIGYADKKMDDAFYENAPSLKMLQLISAGYDKANIEAAQRAGVAICNNGGANSEPVAEHALMLMLALARRLFRQRDEVVSARWERNALSREVFMLEGRTLGIIGLGIIGKKVARLGRAFGMSVRYYDLVRLSDETEAQLHVRFALLNEILETSDFVSLHIPFTPATRHMFGADELAQMKRSAYLINTARGEIIDEAALCRALSEGAIAGAGLDVFEQEPPSAENPLFKLENVVVTPHLAGPIWDTQFPKFRNAFDNIQRVERGERPLWIIPELAHCRLRIDRNN